VADRDLDIVWKLGGCSGAETTEFDACICSDALWLVAGRHDKDAVQPCLDLGSTQTAGFSDSVQPIAKD
jgi:hypothetical protein